MSFLNEPIELGPRKAGVSVPDPKYRSEHSLFPFKQSVAKNMRPPRACLYADDPPYTIRVDKLLLPQDASPGSWKGHNLSGLFVRGTKLAGGAFGQVWVYTDADTRREITVKNIVMNAEAELYVIDTINQKLRSVNVTGPMSNVRSHLKHIIGAQVLSRTRRRVICGDKPGERYIGDGALVAMDKLDGDLKKLRDIANMEFQQTNRVLMKTIFEVAKVLNALMSIEIFYTDIKKENIMFRYETTGHIDIVLIDLGSAQVGAGKQHICSFKPPEARNAGASGYVNADEKTIVYGIGVLIYQMFLKDAALEELGYEALGAVSRPIGDPAIPEIRTARERLMYDNRIQSLALDQQMADAFMKGSSDLAKELFTRCVASSDDRISMRALLQRLSDNVQ